jgi:CheY-like chemotaxis protein
MTYSKLPVPLNILLADDDTDDRFFFEKALQEIPLVTQLTIVKDGEELMHHLEAKSVQLPDVLFLDLSMPRKSGFECLSEIKENTDLIHMPVIMFSTSYARDIHYEQCMVDMLFKIGAENYIRKPGDFEQLKKVIYDALTALQKNNNDIRVSKKEVSK